MNILKARFRNLFQNARRTAAIPGYLGMSLRIKFKDVVSPLVYALDFDFTERDFVWTQQGQTGGIRARRERGQGPHCLKGRGVKGMSSEGTRVIPVEIGPPLGSRPSGLGQSATACWCLLIGGWRSWCGWCG